MLNRIINNEGSGAGEWTLLSRIIWLKATVLAAAGAAWHTVTGAIVSFVTQRAHALKQVVVDINPVQDLHGYDNPWPAGGGKNKLPNPTAQTVTLNEMTCVVSADGQYTLSGTTSGGSFLQDFSVAEYTIQDGDYIHCGNSAQSTVAVVGLRFTDGTGTDFTISSINRIASLANHVGKTINAVRIYVGINTTLNVTIAPMIVASSTATSFAPYSNICPISGWTGCEIPVVGKNLLSTAGNNLPLSAGGISFSYSNGDYIVEAEEEKSGYPFARIGRIALKAGTYTLSITQTSGLGIRLVDRTVSPPVVKWSTTSALTFTVTEKITSLLDIEITATAAAVPTGTHTIHPMLNVGSTPTDYEPYQGNTYAIDWTDEAGTVYGGTLTVNEDGSGSVEVGDNKNTYIGAASENWSLENTGQGVNFYINIPDAKSRQYSGNSRLQSSIFPISTINGVQSGTCYISDGKNLNVTVGTLLGISTVADFKTWLSSNNLEVKYELATPPTYDLTPQQVISTLQGYNNVWANTGDVTVTFRGTPVVEPDEQPLQALNLLLGGAYRNDQTPEDVPDDEALDILLGGGDR